MVGKPVTCIVIEYTVSIQMRPALFKGLARHFPMCILENKTSFVVVLFLLLDFSERLFLITYSCESTVEKKDIIFNIAQIYLITECLFSTKTQNISRY